MNLIKRYLHPLIHHPIAQQMYPTFLDILSPPYCAFCRRLLATRTILCAACRLAIKPIVSATIELTQHQDMQVMAIMEYRDPLKNLILTKSRSDIVTAYDIGHLMWEYTNIRHRAFDYIVPIPLHWTRYAWRGFNQAEEMGKILARKSGKPLVNLIHRTRSTPFQSSLSPLKRSKNVKDVFDLNTRNPALYHGKHLLLVDDLMTTGSTLKEAGKALLKLKPSSITAVVACRVV